jgi:hypothetical protein
MAGRRSTEHVTEEELFGGAWQRPEMKMWPRQECLEERGKEKAN